MSLVQAHWQCLTLKGELSANQAYKLTFPRAGSGIIPIPDSHRGSRFRALHGRPRVPRHYRSESVAA